MNKKLLFSQHISTWLCIALVVLLPWQTRYIFIAGELSGAPWAYGTVSLYAVDILIMLFAFFSLVVVKLKQKYNGFSVHDVLALFLAILALLSVNYATNETASIFWWLKLCEGLALFLVARRMHVKRSAVAIALTISGTIQSILALSQFFLQRVFGSTLLGVSAQLPEDLGVQVVQTGTERVLRAYGSLPHPNMLAGFLVVCILAAIALYMTRHHFIERLAVAVSIALLSAGLWVTFSRQAILALVVALVILVAYTFIRKKTFPRSVTLAVLYVLLPLLTFTAIYPDLVITRTTPQTANRVEQRSFNEREQYIDDSVTLLRTNWLHGVGIGGFTAAIYKQDSKNDQLREGWTYHPVHNIYLLAFTELGILGFVGFLFFIISLVYKLRIHNEYQLAFGLSVGSLLIIGLFDHYLWSQHFGILLFWLLAGLFTQYTQK